MSTMWTNIHRNFVDLLTDSTTGVNSMTNVINTFSESLIRIDIQKTPSSSFNGKFSILMDSLPQVRQDSLTDGKLDYDINVKLQIAFYLSSRTSKDSLNNAYNDIIEIIRKRLTFSTWQDLFLNVEFVNSTPFKFINVNDESFGEIELLFKATYRINTNDT